MYNGALDSGAKTEEPSVADRYLEDFHAGHTFRSGRIRIDADRIKSFASEFDPQLFHLDERAATESLFGGLAASGWHTVRATTLNQHNQPVQVSVGQLIVRCRLSSSGE